MFPNFQMLAARPGGIIELGGSFVMVHLARWQRITGWCGIFSFLFLMVAFFGYSPDLDKELSSDAFLAEARKDDAVLIFGAFAAPAMLLWLWFAAGMRERLAWGMGWSPLRAIGWGSALAGTMLLVGSFIGQGSLMTEGTQDLNLNGDVIRGSFYAFAGLLTAGFAFFGMWLFTSGLAAVAFGGVPKWWGWPALVMGLLTVAAAIVSSEFVFWGFMFWAVWSLVGAIWLAFADEPQLGAVGATTTGREKVDAA